MNDPCFQSGRTDLCTVHRTLPPRTFIAPLPGSVRGAQVSVFAVSLMDGSLKQTTLGCSRPSTA